MILFEEWITWWTSFSWMNLEAKLFAGTSLVLSTHYIFQHLGFFDSFRMEGCRPITHVDTVPMPYVTESSLVHIVVVLWEQSQLEAAEKFTRFFAKNMVAKSDKSELTLVIPTQESFSELKSLVQNLNQQSKKQEIHIESYNGDGSASGLDFLAADLVSNRLGADALIFLCNPFTEIYPDVLNRIRINTISGWQLYSPIPFAEYNPQVVSYPASPPRIPPALNITTNQGIYDNYDTWHISFYAADYLNGKTEFLTVAIFVLKCHFFLACSSQNIRNGAAAY